MDVFVDRDVVPRTGRVGEGEKPDEPDQDLGSGPGAEVCVAEWITVRRVAKAGRWSAGSEVAGHRFAPAERIATDLCQLDQLRVGQIGRARRTVPEASIHRSVGQICNGQLVRQRLEAV